MPMCSGTSVMAIFADIEDSLFRVSHSQNCLSRLYSVDKQHKNKILMDKYDANSTVGRIPLFVLYASVSSYLLSLYSLYAALSLLLTTS